MIANLARGVQGFTSNVFHVAGERPVLVDPGSDFDVVERVRDRGGVEAVLLTHAHPDHVGNLAAVREAFDVPVYGFDPDVEGVDHVLADGERVAAGDHEYEVLHTPGHARDHLCFYASEAGVLFAGDLAFANGGFGRTDLAGADRATLIESIERVLSVTGPDLGALHPGHGPSVESDPYAHVELAARAARTG